MAAGVPSIRNEEKEIGLGVLNLSGKSEPHDTQTELRLLPAAAEN